ncbi:hypothetical protein C2G38_2184128 [Gigaspora rosea]|uniref:Knl1 C-terminal RWD domain-containing protein n=1 Tax=Gigaspora rosea TaxID=44941 RepID=A0A397V853_9GLOM|nr:hypothetical protein C2G38_2184128 [Gigaspora rosea]
MTFDFLQDENVTNLLAPMSENTLTFTLRNFEDTGIIDENGQKRRKSTGRRVSFATTASVREYYKDDAKCDDDMDIDVEPEEPVEPEELDMSLVSENGQNSPVKLSNENFNVLLESIDTTADMSLVESDNDQNSPVKPSNDNFNVLYVESENNFSSPVRQSVGTLDMSLVQSDNDHKSPIKQSNENFNILHVEPESSPVRQSVGVSDMSLIKSENNYKPTIENFNMPNIESKNSTIIIDVASEELRLKEAIEELTAQLRIFEAERDNLIKELQSLQSQRTKLQNEKTELNKGIVEAKRLIQENKCFTEEDRIRYCDQYENLIATNLWRPVTLSDEFVHMVYDDSLQVKINLKAISCEEQSIISIIDASFITNDKMTTEDKQYYQLMICGIQEFMKNVNGPIQITGISKILKDIALYWQKVRKLYREIFVLSFRFPIELIASNDDNTKLYVLSYPIMENIEWTLEHAYGNINEQAIFDTIKTQFSRGGIECIKATCIEILQTVPQ